MTNIIPLTQRIREDNIRVAAAQQDKFNGSWTVILTSHLNAMEWVVPFTPSKAEMDQVPRVEDVLYCILMDVSAYIDNSFIEFGKEFYAVDPLTWNDVARAMKVYADIGEQCKLLREFLGPKFDAYIHETEFDV